MMVMIMMATLMLMCIMYDDHCGDDDDVGDDIDVYVDVIDGCACVVVDVLAPVVQTAGP